MDGVKGIMDGLIAGAEKHLQENLKENDYIEDGLIMCGECNTLKQCRITLFEEEKIVGCICKCEADAMKEEEEARKRADFQNRVKRLRKTGFPESDMERYTFESDCGGNTKVSEAAKKYVENFKDFKSKGKGLLFHGTVGTGKTFYAACIANELINRGIPTLMTNFSRLSNTLQGMFEGRQKYIDSLNEFDLIIIDDLGAERKSEYMQELVFSIIDNRYRAGLPFIITTNLTLAELKSPNDVTNARIYDRVLERCFPIEVSGSSHRRKNVIDDYEETKKLLGL